LARGGPVVGVGAAPALELQRRLEVDRHREIGGRLGRDRGDGALRRGLAKAKTARARQRPSASARRGRRQPSVSAARARTTHHEPAVGDAATTALVPGAAATAVAVSGEGSTRAPDGRALTCANAGATRARSSPSAVSARSTAKRTRQWVIASGLYPCSHMLWWADEPGEEHAMARIVST